MILLSRIRRLLASKSGLLAAAFAPALLLGLAAHSQDLPAPQPSPVPGLAYEEAFFPKAKYNTNVPTPDSVLGFPVGSRPATHAQIEAVFKALAAQSPRCKLVVYGKTHEGRALYYMVIASEANLSRLDSLKADLAKLADPRKVAKEEGDRLAATLPAVAWMAYTIHGDEMSGSDAALAVAYHLAAGADAEVTNLLDKLVVIIDPLMNPDGRDRFLAMQAQNRTVQPSVDDQSLLHTGVWPSGRMNHYLFDMNRDWIFATQPETRGRLRAVNEWNPHYFMESHEMDSQSTFLFLPAREAINPNEPDNVRKWQGEFAKDLAGALEAPGWRYYNGEWNDDWYPGYSSSWSALRGAVANLYEQAAIGTDAVRRGEGTLESYREAVHKQLVSSMANLAFLAKNRQAILADFLSEKRKDVGPDASIPAHTFAVLPSANATRQRRFLDLMALEGFEVYSAGESFTAQGKDRLGREVKDMKFPAGTLLIPARPPLPRLVNAMLEFDPHTLPQFLTDERRDLLRFGRSRIYDITGWSLPMLFDVQTFDLPVGLPSEAQPKPVSITAPTAPMTNSDTSVAYVIDGTDDASVAAAGRLLERGVCVRVADKPFQFDNREFARCSVVVEHKDNANFAGQLTGVVSNICTELSLTAIGVRTGYGPGDLPDLGGEHFVLLKPPRIAIFGWEPIQPYSYGAAWYLIDHVLGLRASYLDTQNLPNTDLRRYNVLVLPDGANADSLKNGMKPLKEWVTAGGTLVAIGSSAGVFASETNGLGATRQLPDVLGKKMDDYRQAVVREWEGRQTTPDPAKVWAFSPPTEVTYPWLVGESDDKDKEEDLKRRDAWRAIFMPAGVLLAGRVDDRSWLTAGCGEYVPLVYSGRTILLAPPTVLAPVRLGFFNPAPPN